MPLKFESLVVLSLFLSPAKLIMKKKIVAFGEVVWDILPDEKVLGGTPSNMVFRCNSFGEEGHLLSRVGDDQPGDGGLKTPRGTEYFGKQCSG
jgi:hypothetical protein